jgi:hypothetical protein
MEEAIEISARLIWLLEDVDARDIFEEFTIQTLRAYPKTER